MTGDHRPRSGAHRPTSWDHWPITVAHWGSVVDHWSITGGRGGITGLVLPSGALAYHWPISGPISSRIALRGLELIRHPLALRGKVRQFIHMHCQYD